MSTANKLFQAAAGAGGESVYVDDVFSTYLYDGNSSTQTITNGIDLSGEGGLVWVKGRGPTTGYANILVDTVRGRSYELQTNSTTFNIGPVPANFGITSFNSNGFSLGTNWGGENASGEDYVSWSFRKAEKFFDVLTYTGNGTTQNISHNLGSTPAVIIVKNTQSATFWAVYHKDVPNFVGFLNATNAFDTSNTQNFGNNTNPVAPTDSVFTVGQQSLVNSSGETYVAYLFASDAGGFGDDGSENIIKCESYPSTNSADGPTVTLGFEPQWVLIKESSASGNAWSLYDMMRNGTMDQHLRPNAADAEATAAASPEVLPQATGFKLNTSSGRVNRSQTYIYIAIRRPMETPESGTEVFSPQTYTGDGTNSKTFTGAGFPPDLVINNDRTRTNTRPWFDRLRGGKQRLTSTAASVESVVDYGVQLFDTMDGYIGGTGDANTFGFNASSITYANYYFKRATGFFDVVAYTGGTGSPYGQYNHNLGVAPELMMVKNRDSATSWYVYAASEGATKETNLNGSSAFNTGSSWQNITPTATKFAVNTSTTNNTGSKYIAYLFATLAGVSKVGSYTGTGASQNIDCGFSTGARFILIKRTNSTGDWWVWDSARGITAGNDPFLQLNNTGAEVTATDYIDPLSSGFILDPNSTGATGLNASGSNYIFLAIA
jgi:hypothetical protein